MAIFNGKLALHDVEDVEQFAAKIVHFSGLDLSHHEREDLTVFLVETAWMLSERYDPAGVSSFRIWHCAPCAFGLSTRSEATEGERNGASPPVVTSGPERNLSHSTTASAALAVNWTGLSPRSMATLRLVAIPISRGYLPSEVARDLKTSMRWVSERLDELREEIERQRD